MGDRLRLCCLRCLRTFVCALARYQGTRGPECPHCRGELCIEWGAAEDDEALECA